jgi:hypothetical protein
MPVPLVIHKRIEMVMLLVHADLTYRTLQMLGQFAWMIASSRSHLREIINNLRILVIHDDSKS